MSNSQQIDDAARPLLQKEFRSIIHGLAFRTDSKKDLLAWKSKYDSFVCQEGLCTDQGQELIVYLDRYSKAKHEQDYVFKQTTKTVLITSMMALRHHWIGYYVNNYVHMGNRTSNRVESTHSGIKRHNKTSSGSLDLVTKKIRSWVESRV